MANTVDIYTPRYLAEVVRSAPPVHTYLRDTFFTNIQTFPTERVDIDIVKGDRRMAAFVHPRAGAEVLKAQGYRTESYKPPLVSPYDITTADQLMQRLPGETLYSGRTPAQRAAARLTDEYNALNDAITRREEWMAAQALLTGQIPVVGKGVNEVIDFGFTNIVDLTEDGATPWDDSSATILDNLEDWVDTVTENGFVNVDTCIMGKEAYRAFYKNADVQSILDNRRIELGQITPANLPNGVKYVGRITRPVLDIYTYSEVYYDDWTDPDNPETKPLIPDGAVLLISSNANFMMAYGLCTYIEDAGQWVTAETTRLLRSYVDHHPDRRMLEAQSRPLPIPNKVDSWLSATVVATSTSTTATTE